MEKRSFILGLGVGIIFSVAVIWIAFGFSNFEQKELTAEEIEQKAKELGMDYTFDDFSTTELQTESITTELQTEIVTVSSKFEEKRTEAQEITTTDLETTFKSNKTKLENEINFEISTETNLEITSQTQSNAELIDVTITSGSNAKKVSLILQEKGVIKSADEFERYLINNHKTKNIKTGNYKIIKYIDFKTLSEIITKESE